MKSAAVALQCSGAGAPEVVQHFYQIFFCVGLGVFLRFSFMTTLISEDQLKR